jgi:excisionase family DNA binding protein
LIRDGAFPNAFKLGEHYRIPRGDVDAYLRKQRLSKKTAAA